MITTVTTTTVTTVLTAGMAGSLAAIAVVTLLVLLIQREIVTASAGPRARAIGQTLNVVIVPLFLGFLLVAAVTLLNVLR